MNSAGGHAANEVSWETWYDADMVAKVIELPDELQRRIEELSRQMGRAESDLVRDAIETFVETHQVPQPSSDGTIDDPDLAGRDIDEWLAANWHPE